MIWVASATQFGDKYQDYQKRWRDKFKKDPAGLYAVATRDAFDIWVQAVERAGTKAGNKGADAALRALEMVDVYRQLGAKPSGARTRKSGGN